MYYRISRAYSTYEEYGEIDTFNCKMRIGETTWKKCTWKVNGVNIHLQGAVFRCLIYSSGPGKQVAGTRKVSNIGGNFSNFWRKSMNYF